MNTTESLRQVAQLPLWLETLKEQLRAELVAQNAELSGVKEQLAQQNAQLEKLIDVMVTMAEMLRQRLESQASHKS
jgi:hypothetical protein